MIPSLDDGNDPNVKVFHLGPLGFVALFASILVLTLGIAFHETVRGWFAGSPGKSGDLTGEWVGELDMPTMSDSYIRPLHKKAAIRFTLGRTEHFLTRYGGKGQLTIQGEPAQPIEITNLWLASPDSGSFEAGLWKDPYRNGDPADYVSGGYEGSYSNGTLAWKRQSDVGYAMAGTLTRGTDQDYARLVQDVNSGSKH